MPRGRKCQFKTRVCVTKDLFAIEIIQASLNVPTVVAVGKRSQIEVTVPGVPVWII